MEAKWKDRTSYSQGDRERTPKIWELTLPSCCVSVHRHIRHSPDVWLVSCHELSVKDRSLSARGLPLAQAEALGVVRRAAALIVEDISKVENA